MTANRPISSVWGERRGGGDPFEARSPLDGSILAAGETLGDLSTLGGSVLPHDLDLASAGATLAKSLRGTRMELIDALRRETGFVPKDCEELIDGSLAYAKGYAAHPSTRLVPRGEEIRSERRMRLVDVPVGTVAAILPHNAFLPLALSCMMNGLRAGNRVILRAPQQSALSAALLADALERTPEIAPWVSVTVCSARPFIDWFFGSPEPGVLQFFGSSRRAADLVARGFDAAKPILIDGEGNSWVYVGRDVDASRVADILVGGAFRYNGETCTSINGAMVHPDRYEEVLNLVAERARALRAGRGEDDEVGPLFDEPQAEWCLGRILESGGEIVAGGTRDGALLKPTVVARPHLESELLIEGLFGPAFWIAPGDADAFTALWPTNRFPLCAAILEEPADPAAWAARLPNLARLVLNGDPSVEDPFEYWGGYPPSGQNPVSPWPAKYRRVLQIDEPL